MELDDRCIGNLDHAMNQGESELMRRAQSEMFRLFGLWTKGEANQLVRSCEDASHASQREITRSKKIENMRETSKATDVWASKIVELKKEHGEERPTEPNASLLFQVLPDQVQLIVAQDMNSKKLD